MSQIRIEPGLIYYIHKHGYSADYRTWQFSSFVNYLKKDPGDLFLNEFIEDEDIHNSIMRLHNRRLDLNINLNEN